MGWLVLCAALACRKRCCPSASTIAHRLCFNQPGSTRIGISFGRGFTEPGWGTSISKARARREEYPKWVSVCLPRKRRFGSRRSKPQNREGGMKCQDVVSAQVSLLCSVSNLLVYLAFFLLHHQVFHHQVPPPGSHHACINARKTKKCFSSS